MNESATSEKAKLTANLLNGLSLAILVATIIGPAAKLLSGTSALFGTASGLCIAVVCHLVARAALGPASRTYARWRNLRLVMRDRPNVGKQMSGPPTQLSVRPSVRPESTPERPGNGH